jgi:phosphoserine phosphatase RsbU/P
VTETVLLVGLDDQLAARVVVPSGLRTQRLPLGDLGQADLNGAVIAAVLGPGGGPRLAQELHRAAPDATVIFLTSDEVERDSLLRTLAITPNIGRNTRGIAGDDPDIAATVIEELELARRRFEYGRTVERVSDALRDLEAATADRAPRYLGQLFTHAPIGILVVDASGHIEAANPRIEEVLGWAPHHAVGTGLVDIFSGEAGVAARELVERSTTQGEVTTEVLVRTGPAGGTQHVEVRAAPVDPDHPELGAIILLSDETGLIAALENAERARAAAEAAADRYATVARTLQESLLPPDLPKIPGADAAAMFHPAGDGSQIGGDFYDLFQVGDDEWFAVVGDVCGKGAAAARLTALARYTLRAAATRSPDLERNLVDLNAALLQQGVVDQRRDDHRFVTLAALRFRSGGDRLVVRAAVAGHPQPLVVRSDGRVDELECTGRLLGMFEDINLGCCEVELEPGDVLVTITDGVTEARRGTELFGEERVHDLLSRVAGSTPQEMVDAIGDAVLGFQVSLARDDIAVLAVAPSPTAQAENIDDSAGRGASTIE